jgi:hypothetical protein
MREPSLEISPVRAIPSPPLPQPNALHPDLWDRACEAVRLKVMRVMA